ncbi:MAG: cell division protein ZapA [endosymbiont of Galathealinum brachiosum]|uniref:Cell division protein ZapA n=1 Tax=endosymbiont of Galathealinum brachiosum TaxID=2200906 RepID=A0A370DDR9_9GAMM|nr:MAG: cell division protein ZapA [endosymbiont of Galathealinum brachiosum]
MSDSSGLNIRIMDKDYRVACPADQQSSLKDSADFLNDRLDDIKNKGSIIGTERIAVMAALNLAHELLSSHVSMDSFSDVDNRMLNLQKKIDIALRDIEVA